ncbi:hypothetical protein F966_02164 [Acinetobacter higginsii]|uniref:Exonuclease domain-containing protein n=1 Tax=Acinetobacter higginsii TaxID=70347 RepID=N8WC72_9GAMM|nr:DUF3820 family protein [Acinetobacter higginsii]ENV09506.1 hypothetical protein F966_02164 [Acinetobacter higginsii]
MSAIILDTETHDMNGYPIEIAHVPVSFLESGELSVDKDACFDEYFSCPKGSVKSRESIRNAHNAKQDILLTAVLLKQICKSLGIKDMQSLYLFSEQARIPTRMPYGKHKHTLIKDLPADYVSWLLRQDDLDPYIKKALVKGQ